MSKSTFNPARKGPVKVWSGYRNLRVPLELFDDVRKYLEQRKIEYLGGTVGALITSSEEENRIEELTKRVQKLEALVNKLMSSNISSEEIKQPKTQKLTSKERLFSFLKEHAGERYSTVQLARILELPDATCRQSARELAETDPNIHQIPGRPNKYYYSTNQA
ncbi:MAG: hypothetical protein D6732_09200 [Methanobacteriota archaeon]|nr:MAG: hypothetical protein D6732_09200 [Euryarchaeota archaeon]